MLKFKIALAGLLIVASASSVKGQTVDSQKFTVTVPTSIAIIAPENASIIHDESENDQTFPAQSWVIKGNSTSGVTATFATAQPFTHTLDASQMRDVQLGLAVGSSIGGATWTLGQAADATDYANNDDVASVQVSSNGFGSANMDVSVTFVTNGFGTFLAGDYDTTVTGTVTAN